MKKDSFKERYMKEYSWITESSTYFYTVFPPLPQREIAMVLPKQRERQQKLLARWLATVLRTQLTG